MSLSRPPPMRSFACPSFTRCACSHDARRRVAPVAVTDEALVELAGRWARELTIGVDRPRAFVVREVLAAEREQLAFEIWPRRVEVGRLHDCVHLLAHLGVGDA